MRHCLATRPGATNRTPGGLSEVAGVGGVWPDDREEAKALVEGCGLWGGAQADTAEASGAIDKVLDKAASDASAAISLCDIEVPQPANARIVGNVGIAIEATTGDKGIAIIDAEKALAGCVETVGAGVPVGDQAVEEGVVGGTGFEDEEPRGIDWNVCHE